jgi:Na+(H+)/acetate symporter ActP
MAGAGALVSLLLGVSSTAGQDIVVAVVGLLMIFYVMVGGMKAPPGCRSSRPPSSRPAPR